MTRDIQEMSIQELENVLSELENNYAELLGNDHPDGIFNQLFKQIKTIREELESRK